MVALIPARAGSKRCPGKNTRFLDGAPLIAYTIAAAQESGVFVNVLVCSDDVCARAGADAMGAGWMVRSTVSDDQPDIEWVRDALALKNWDAFAILRPTSPFRTAATIRRAYDQFRRSEVHSLRAVQPVKEHPGKMWEWAGPGYPMTSLFGGHVTPTPWHSSPTQTLPKFYVQNASLEMAWSYVVQSFGSISGKKIAPFFTEGYEGFDINDEDDFATAARLVAEGRVTLPQLPARTPDQPTAA
jgi:CMP-N,N'-diacetyllegionaminic acid synthase